MSDKLQRAYRVAAYKAKEQRLETLQVQETLHILQTRAAQHPVIRGSAPDRDSSSSVPVPAREPRRVISLSLQK